MEKKKVAIGMSGGIDSTVTAYILKEQGYEIFGITMKVWGKEGDDTPEAKAKKVCDDLGIKHYVVDFRDDFRKYVVDNFIDEYKKGRTPNPCVRCNKYIKMGKLFEEAMKLGADYLATGHYAVKKDGYIYMGDDIKKDQAYFLAQINKENLIKILFPLGNYKKEDIKKMAEEKGIKVYSKGESQEICFIEDDDYKRFLLEETNGDIKKEGNIVDINGKNLGNHTGTAFYTIGQRKGLGIANKTPLYVVEVDNEKNTVIVGDNEDLLKKELEVNNVNIISEHTFEELNNMECLVKTRSRDSLHEGVLEIISNDEIKIKFKDKVRAITPGQLAVFYSKSGKVIGGGYIK